MWRALISALLFATLAACPFRGRAQGIEKLVEEARAAQLAGNYADAAQCYRRASALAPGSAELWANRGMVEYLADQYSASATSLKHALQLNPNLFVPLLFLGKTYIQTGRAAQSLPYLNRAHSQRPNDPEVLLGLGKAHAALSRQREAASYYAEATQVAPTNAEAWLGLGGSSLEVIAEDGRNLATSAKHSVWAQALYADELLAQDRPLEAADTYKAIFHEATPTQKIVLLRNMEWMQAHPDSFLLPPDSQGTLEKLAAQLRLEPSLPPLPACGPAMGQQVPEATAILGAACAYWAGDYKHSAAAAGQLLKVSPQNSEALYWSLKANERLAVAALSRFEELAPKSPTSYDLVGDLYRDQRRADSAIAEYKKSLAIDPHDSVALLGIAAAYFSAGDFEQAAAMARIALEDRPLDPQLNLLMAEILEQGNDFAQAKPYLAKCQTAPPELQSKVHYLLARAVLDEGNKQGAIQQLELALPGDKDGSMHYMLSRLYRETGNLAASQKTMTEAKALIKKRDASAAIAVREATSPAP